MAQNQEKSMLSFTEEDVLGLTGERIIADRYLLKDTKKETLSVGSLVVAVLDKKRAYHEVAKVMALHTQEGVVTEVDVELRSGEMFRLPISQIDVLQEQSPKAMWRRIAKGVSKHTKHQKKNEERFYQLQTRYKYVPGGRINASMGTGMKTTSYNCFVIPYVGPTPDHYAESFGRTLEIQARSGGVGMNLSFVPPQGTLCQVKTPDAQDLVQVLDVWHPDLFDFLEEKLSYTTKVVLFNEAFDQAVQLGLPWTFLFPDPSEPRYDKEWDGNLQRWMENGLPVIESERVPAKTVLERLLKSGVALIEEEYFYAKRDALHPYREITENNKNQIVFPGDSRQSIARAVAEQWRVQLSGKRPSIFLSTLRPRYAYVKGVNGRSSGAYSWSRLYDGANWAFANGFGPVSVAQIMSIGCQLTLQGGSRRGALMIILNDDHSDIEKFITAKQTDGVITGANISVGISEAFMQAKKDDDQIWHLGYTLPEFFEQGKEGRVPAHGYVTTDRIRANTLWNMITESAWRSAEPGVVFLGRSNEMSNSNYFNPLIATNPCGEQALPADGICNLGAVNLSVFTFGFLDRPTGKEAFADAKKEAYVFEELKKHLGQEKAEKLLYHIRWSELEETVRAGLRFQDGVIDATYYPFAENEQTQLAERRVGLGIMGLHDLMLYCHVRYGSDESAAFARLIMGLITEWAYLESVEIAKEQGSFPKFDVDKFLASGFMRHMAQHKPHVVEAIRQYGIRNVTSTTIAPTGTTGTMVGCSTGCEPYYAWSYFRNSRLGVFEENAKIVDVYKDTHEDSADTLPDYFVSAMELTPEEHVKVQGALQEWVDSSISKTCNAPNHYTVEDTKRLYDTAYELGCKGITIYRDGSRSEQVLETKKENKAETTDQTITALDAQEQDVVAATSTVQDHAASFLKNKKKRPDVLYGATYKKQTPMGPAYITINDDPENNLACEMFINVGKAGSDVAASNEALGRAITLYLKDSHNPNKEATLVKHFSGIGGQNAVGFGPNRITSVPDAIAKSMIEHVETFPLRQNEWSTYTDRETTSREEHAIRQYSINRDLCPNCQSMSLVNHGGCNECEACGFSKC